MVNQCPLADGLLISIPQGQSMKIECPVHGSHTIHNPVKYTL